MAAKSNIRSMRFSDTMIEMIEAQAGETFTAKFEALVTRCMWELPEKEKQLKEIEKKINAKKQEMAEASSRYARMLNQLSNLERKFQDLDYAIGRALDEWPNYEA
ncbi:MAG: hypothetical protein PUB51_02550 [Oscillospiraceae bacterium]|nr:hypothetical protein [Oscillospiraceae bacterium]